MKKGKRNRLLAELYMGIQLQKTNTGAAVSP